MGADMTGESRLEHDDGYSLGRAKERSRDGPVDLSRRRRLLLLLFYPVNMLGVDGAWRAVEKESTKDVKTQVASLWTSRLPPARAARWLDRTLFHQPSVHKRVAFPCRGDIG